jgi:hypothetical protein
MDLHALEYELGEIRALLTIQVAVLLQQKSPHEQKTLEEWIEYVCWLQIQTRRIGHTVTMHRDEEIRQRYQEFHRELSSDEAAQLVTGLARIDRARKRFNEFCKYLRQPNTSMSLSEHKDFLGLDSAHTMQPSLLWPHSTCLWLKSFYSKWQRLAGTQKVRRAAKKRWTKKSQKIA